MPDGEAPIPSNPPTHNVRDYGAVGDGITDDTAALRAALLAAKVAGGGVVFMPAGTYVVTSTLAVNGSNIVLRGAGVDATKLWITRALSDVFPGTWYRNADGGWVGGCVCAPVVPVTWRSWRAGSWSCVQSADAEPHPRTQARCIRCFPSAGASCTWGEALGFMLAPCRTAA